MAGNPIDIVVTDKIDKSIAENLRKIGQAAKEAGSDVDQFNAKLGQKPNTSGATSAATAATIFHVVGLTLTFPSHVLLPWRELR